MLGIDVRFNETAARTTWTHSETWEKTRELNISRGNRIEPRYRCNHPNLNAEPLIPNSLNPELSTHKNQANGEMVLRNTKALNLLALARFYDPRSTHVGSFDLSSPRSACPRGAGPKASAVPVSGDSKTPWLKNIPQIILGSENNWRDIPEVRHFGVSGNEVSVYVM